MAAFLVRTARAASAPHAVARGFAAVGCRCLQRVASDQFRASGWSFGSTGSLEGVAGVATGAFMEDRSYGKGCTAEL